MGRRPKSGEHPAQSVPTAPTSFPQTPPPPVGADLSGWVLTAVNRLESSSGKMDARLDAIERALEKLDGSIGRVESEIKGHGKWMHTLQVVGGIIVLVMSWTFVNAVWPWLKPKLGL
ncbi:MAG: hypothetical protein KF709_02550 [Gemmatimonadaceae bacterium]|nr:hypothetical protein [Gemmatimonadaceae bacterium]